MLLKKGARLPRRLCGTDEAAPCGCCLCALDVMVELQCWEATLREATFDVTLNACSGYISPTLYTKASC